MVVVVVVVVMGSFCARSGEVVDGGDRQRHHDSTKNKAACSLPATK